ncbi:Uncharacterized protein DAT39_010382, partial [Clarias magur]
MRSGARLSVEVARASFVSMARLRGDMETKQLVRNARTANEPEEESDEEELSEDIQGGVLSDHQTLHVVVKVTE